MNMSRKSAKEIGSESERTFCRTKKSPETGFGAAFINSMASRLVMSVWSQGGEPSLKTNDRFLFLGADGPIISPLPAAAAGGAGGGAATGRVLPISPPLLDTSPPPAAAAAFLETQTAAATVMAPTAAAKVRRKVKVAVVP
jgi:hypothetical protein